MVGVLQHAGGDRRQGAAAALGAIMPAESNRPDHRLVELVHLHRDLASIFGDEDAMRRVRALVPMLPSGRGAVGPRKGVGRPKGAVTYQTALRDIGLLVAAEIVRDAFRMI
jgi:hypothetical protein